MTLSCLRAEIDRAGPRCRAAAASRQSTPFRRERDAYKQSLVEAAGHRVIRLTEDDTTPERETLTMARVWRALE